MKRIAIVGLGLIGGSLALSLRARHANLHVSAIDLPEVLGSEPAFSIADKLVAAADETAMQVAFGASELVILAAPVRTIMAVLPAALTYAPTVTDCGSTKRAIVQVAEGSARRSLFVAGHPMAGLPQGGLHNARADLFEGHSWILCAEGSAPEALAQVGALIRDVGSSIVSMTADEHDRAVAQTSHVPQVLASALAVLADRSGASLAAGPAFASATRVAGGSAAMWGDIFSTNADAIVTALGELGVELERVGRSLAGPDVDTTLALALLAEAGKLRPKG